MTTIDSVVLEAADPSTTEGFYAAAFGPAVPVEVRAGDSPATGFRRFTLSLVVAQPNTVDLLLGSATDSGATVLKPAAKNLWGYGGVVQAPDGAIWKVATSTKKNSGPATRQVDDVVLLLGVADVKASKQFYVERGLTVKRSFGSKYVEFDGTDSPIKLALYGIRALAKDAGVSPDGSGAHRIAVRSDAGTFTDLDGFEWEALVREGR